MGKKRNKKQRGLDSIIKDLKETNNAEERAYLKQVYREMLWAEWSSFENIRSLSNDRLKKEHIKDRIKQVKSNCNDIISMWPDEVKSLVQPVGEKAYAKGVKYALGAALHKAEEEARKRSRTQTAEHKRSVAKEMGSLVKKIEELRQVDVTDYERAHAALVENQKRELQELKERHRIQLEAIKTTQGHKTDEEVSLEKQLEELKKTFNHGTEDISDGLALLLDHLRVLRDEFVDFSNPFPEVVDSPEDDTNEVAVSSPAQ
jgi:Asp-tRNA(Asn)/Glu-tRNA(Gln) amidotransferase C subunit